MNDVLDPSGDWFREIFQNAMIGLYQTAPDGRILLANPALLNMLGFSSLEELTQRNLGEEGYEPNYSREFFMQRMETEGRVVAMESAWIRRDGTALFIRESAVAVRDEQGKTLYYEGTVEDITERKRMEMALRASERNYREIFNAAADAIFIHDADTGAILDVNETMLRMYGCSYVEALQANAGSLSQGEHPYSEENARAWIRKTAAEGPQSFEWLCRKATGEAFWGEVSLKPVIIGGKHRVLAVVRDITDRKEAEAQAQQHLAELARAWRVNTLGEMASGLAHELNQPLYAIVNHSGICTRLLRREPLEMDALRGSLQEIASQAQRAGEIIKRGRNLIAKREPVRAMLDLNGIVRDALRVLHSEILRHHVAVKTSLADHLPPIQGDSVEIEQVVLNLMKNAIEAMAGMDADHRILTVSSGLSSDMTVEITVADTGPGLSPCLFREIFKSFFTTKPEGLGIGLSLSRRIVDAHGGRLWPQSDGNSGATFRFTLPIDQPNSPTHCTHIAHEGAIA